MEMEITTTRTVTSYSLEGSGSPGSMFGKSGGQGEVQMEIIRGENGGVGKGGRGEVQMEILQGENGGGTVTRTTKTTSYGGSGGSGGGSLTMEYSNSSSSNQTGASSSLTQAQV